MIKKKLMKHFKLRSVMKTMVLATAVMCGLTAGSTTAKAAGATATPTPTITPFPKVNVVFSLNNYETDDYDYKTSYAYYESIYSYSTEFAVNETEAKMSEAFLTGNPSGLFEREVEQGTKQASKFYMKFDLNNSQYIFNHTASNETGTYLLCESEEGKDKGYTKEISFNLSNRKYNDDGSYYESVINKEYEGIHLGIPSNYIFLDGKHGSLGDSNKDIILKKQNVSNLFGEDNAEYSGTLYTVKDIDSKSYMKFVTNLRMKTPSNMSTNRIWTTPEQVYVDGKKDDAYEVIGIGSGALEGNYNTIKTVNISKNIRFIESGAFSSEANLQEVNFEVPENITYIGENAFYDSGIEIIDLTGLLRSEDGCSVLSRSVFENCNNLKTVILDNSGKEIKQAYLPSRLFKNCSNLSNVEWGNIKNIQIGDETFFRTIISDIDFSADQKVQIGQYAFRNCSNIENVNIAGECEIQEGAFYGCFKNKEGSATFGASVELDGYAFANCTNLTTVDFASKKQSEYSSYITATPIPTATVAPTATPEVTAIPSITATPEPTKIPVNIGYGETIENYLSTHPDWYETFYKKNPDGYAFITATPTPNPSVTITATPTPVKEVYKGDTVTLYKGCFENTGITSVIINADHINLHMECFNGMPTVNLKIRRNHSKRIW